MTSEIVAHSVNGANTSHNKGHHPPILEIELYKDIRALVEKYPAEFSLLDLLRQFTNAVYSGEGQNGGQERRRYTVRTAGDALTPHPPTPYIVDGLIVERSTNIFYGEPGSGKTFSLASLIVCVAAGIPWLGYPTKRVPVLFIDEESGDFRLGKRLGAAIRGEEQGADLPLSYVSLANFKLNKDEDVSEIRSLILETGAKLVVIDALAPVMEGDENSKEDVQPIMNSLRKLADQTSAAIIVIHHNNKNGGYRGSSAIKGALDLLVLVKQEQGNVLRFFCEKNRDGVYAEWAGVATWSNWDTPDETFTMRPHSVPKSKSHQPAPSVRYVIDLVRERQPVSTPELKQVAIEEGVYGEETIGKAIQIARENGWIYRTNPGESGRGVSALWAIQEAEND